MLTEAGNRGTVCATDERAAGIEDLQLTTGVGPCIDAVTSGSPVLIADLDRSEGVDLARWAPLGDLPASGVRVLFAFPLRIGAITVGALDLYRDTPANSRPRGFPRRCSLPTWPRWRICNSSRQPMTCSLLSRLRARITECRFIKPPAWWQCNLE